MICLLAALILTLPWAQALDRDALLDAQSGEIGIQALEAAGEEYTGPQDLRAGPDVNAALRFIADRGGETLRDAVCQAGRSCVLLLTVSLLWSMAQGFQTAAGKDPMETVTLAACLSVTAVAVGDVHSLLALGRQAMDRMESLSDVLLPAVSMATAASGSPGGAAVRHGATILFSDLLIRLIRRVLIPLCYAFVASIAAWACLGSDGLKRLGGLIKWLITILLSAVLLGFLLYLNLTGVIAGGADAATVKAAKFTISNLVPVVGGVISDTAETLLAGASVLRNAVGVFGMLAVGGICVGPFLNLGVHYLLYRCTAALAATAAGEGRVTGLIDGLSTAFALILAMTGACAVLLLVAMVSAVSAVTP